MNSLYLTMTYLPYVFGVAGIILFFSYVLIRILKKKDYRYLLFFACILIALFALAILGYYIIGYLGVGPISK